MIKVLKHIVFIVGVYKNGGVERRSTTLANQFAKKGYKCTILVTQEISDKQFFHTEKNVEIVFLRDYAEDCRKKQKNNSEKIIKAKIKLLKKLQHAMPSSNKVNKRLSRKIKMLRGGQELSMYVSNNPQSIYIPFGWYHTSLLYEVSKRIKLKCVYAEKNSPEVEFSQNPNDIEYFFEIISKLNGAVMQTKEELSFYEAHIKNSIVIHNPIRDDLPEPFQYQRRKVIVNFCRVSSQKNLMLLMEAFLAFNATHPDYTLEIYGNTITDKEKSYLEELTNWVSERKLEHTIKFLPPRADVHEIVKDCSMFVSSSDYEGLSNSMLEAMAIGLPCVCTDCLGGGASEMITDSENGLLVPMRDANALATAMCHMADDETLANRCSENAQKIRYELSAENIANKWLKYIESVV